MGVVNIENELELWDVAQEYRIFTTRDVSDGLYREFGIRRSTKSVGTALRHMRTMGLVEHHGYLWNEKRDVRAWRWTERGRKAFEDVVMA